MTDTTPTHDESTSLQFPTVTLIGGIGELAIMTEEHFGLKLKDLATEVERYFDFDNSHFLARCEENGVDPELEADVGLPFVAIFNGMAELITALAAIDEQGEEA